MRTNQKMAVPTPQFYCSLCDEDDLEFAIAYCEDDNQNYCRAHLDSHAAFPSTRTHRTHDLLNTQGKTHCDHTDEQTSYCKDHQVLCCIPCKVFGHSECESVNNVGDYLKNKDIIKEKCSRMSRKMKSRKNIVDKKSSSAHDQEDKWISKMNEAVTQMNEVKAELERKISNKIDYVRQIMNKKRESLDNEQAQLEEAIEQLDNIMTVIPEGHSKLETFQAVYNAEKTIKQCEQIQKTRPGNCHIEFLKAEHNFEAQHYVNGSLLCFTQAVEKINRVYSEIQKYLPHIREEESDEPVRMAPFSAIQEESIPLVHKLHVPDSNIQNDETMRKLQVPQPRTRSRSLDCSSAIYRGRDHRRRLSDCYESLISYSEKEAYPSIPTRQQCVMMAGSNMSGMRGRPPGRRRGRARLNRPGRPAVGPKPAGLQPRRGVGRPRRDASLSNVFHNVDGSEMEEGSMPVPRGTHKAELDIGLEMDRWQELMERQDVDSHEELAKMLLDSWELKETGKELVGIQVTAATFRDFETYKTRCRRTPDDLVRFFLRLDAEPGQTVIVLNEEMGKLEMKGKPVGIKNVEPSVRMAVREEMMKLAQDGVFTPPTPTCLCSLL
ncbi:hypothetical protein MAR_009170 [Mya arenaria]|uniref:Uncharacterized protein n=1 Tax=Mya arenaria TaxID=6604 RepID=A0ABY7E0V3_MYAAR|nr:hypothetical protein MAR_009127 [Mya arenaria]WAR02612.1 hypothetical protein MAR_009170 [Mya arenaria]